MPKKKQGLFSCFGGGSDEQPEIRYEPDGGVNLQAIEHDLPMPDSNELEEKFTELVVRTTSLFYTISFYSIYDVSIMYSGFQTCFISVYLYI